MAADKIAQEGKDFVRISISDTGTGVPEDIKETIFEEFRHFSSETARPLHKKS